MPPPPVRDASVGLDAPRDDDHVRMNRVESHSSISPSSINTAPNRIAAPIGWVPSSYFAEGVPFAIVIWVTGTMLKDLGHSDAEITLATGTIAIAWSAKPLWAAFLDMAKTKKMFVLAMEFTIAALLAAIA